MTDLLSWRTLIVVVAFVLAGLVKGVTGMGLPTVTMGLLGSIMAPVEAAALLLVPTFVTNVWQMLAGPYVGAIARRLWPLLATMVVGTLAGSRLLTSANATWTSVALGAALVASSTYNLLARPLAVPPRAEARLSPLVGLATGVVNGSTGVTVVPLVPYIHALGFDRDDLIQALGLSFTVAALALALGLALGGAVHAGNLGASTLALGPAFVGMWIGQTVRRRISPSTFRRWFLIGLIALGLELMARHLV